MFGYNFEGFRETKPFLTLNSKFKDTSKMICVSSKNQIKFGKIFLALEPLVYLLKRSKVNLSIFFSVFDKKEICSKDDDCPQKVSSIKYQYPEFLIRFLNSNKSSTKLKKSYFNNEEQLVKDFITKNSF
ncbi:hypothetical protein BpHYR1_032242 [Brachionus plicatilis]|uniref:Uncharacterized protein n=1 Tax=Brachionus plicatilis TaxID=10195 RepID=A0A3M7TAQ3_BRAPC|nr:hypothetical protein BpHYR1_032242 [Brachionus plicatilis]